MKVAMERSGELRAWTLKEDSRCFLNNQLATLQVSKDTKTIKLGIQIHSFYLGKFVISVTARVHESDNKKSLCKKTYYLGFCFKQ